METAVQKTALLRHSVLLLAQKTGLCLQYPFVDLRSPDNRLRRQSSDGRIAIEADRITWRQTEMVSQEIP